MGKILAVFFDWDGVIQDTLPAIYEATCEVFRSAKIDPPCFEYFCRSLSAPYADWFHAQGVDMFTDEERQDIYWTSLQVNDSPLTTESREALRDLSDQGIKLAIVSSGPTELLWRMIEKFGLSKYLDVVTGDAEVKVEALIQTCKSLKIMPRQALFLGDLSSDVRDGKRAGLCTGAYIGKYGSVKSFESVSPDYVIFSHHQLVALISMLSCDE